MIVGGHAYAPTTVPTVGCSPPLFAQILSTAIARASITLSNEELAYDAFVDNVRFCGDSAALARVEPIFRAVCADIGVSINPDEAGEDDVVFPGGQEHCLECLEKYVFLGIVFDHRNRTVALSRKTKQN